MEAAFRSRRGALPSWVRSKLCSFLGPEASFLARHQVKVSRPWLDKYFLYSSVLGTHNFFMIFLPAFYQQLEPHVGRSCVFWTIALWLTLISLIFISAFAAFFCAFIKDYLCIPRPLSPPVRRLTMGTHHLEYGFPSTHSANGAGMTVFFYHCLLLWRTAIENKGEADRIPIVDYLVKDTYLLETVLILYAITIVYGRIYMGMHSLSDCIAGVVIGVSVALFSIKYDTFLGAYLEQPTILVPLSVVVLAVFLLYIHPIPIQVCPCYEDVVAFLGAFVGVCVGEWWFNMHQQRCKRTYAFFGFVGQLLPVWLRLHLEANWLWFVSKNSVPKVTVALVLGVAPLVLFKLAATPIIKGSVSVLYDRVYAWWTSSEESTSKTITATAKVQRHVTSETLRQRKPKLESRATSSKVQKLEANTDETNPFDDDRFKRDAARLMVYIGMGFVGAGSAYSLVLCLRLA